MNFDLEKVKPQEHGKTDKYSWNLYRFLRKYKKKGIEVFLLDGDVIIAPKNLQCSCHPAIVNGAMPKRIRAGKFQEWAYCGKEPRQEITEEFIKNYSERGIDYLEEMDRAAR